MKPNLVFPLASSYDERGMIGYTSTTSGYDQRKINCFYEIVQNPISGKTTLVLSKRPGVTRYEATTLGVSTQVPYMAVTAEASGTLPILFVKDGNITKSVDQINGSVTILNSASYAPNYITKTNISGTTTYVVQLRQSAPAGAAQRVFYSSTLASWTEITDSVFTAINHQGQAVHMNGSMFILGPTGIWGSDLNTLATWQSTNFVAKAIEQDYAMGLLSFKGQIWAMGEKTAELFVYTSNSAGSNLMRVPERFSRVGLGRMVYTDNSRTAYSAVVDDTLFFIGRFSDTYTNCLVAYDGSRFERVSGDYEQKLLNTNLYGVQSFSFLGRNAVAILMTPPNTSPCRWLMFFPETKSWFEWESTVFSAINAGNWFTGIEDTKDIYSFAGDVFQDDATNYQFLTQFRLPIEDDERKLMLECGVQADTSTGTLNVSFNDTDGTTYGSARTLDMSASRKSIARCGMFRNRFVRLDYTGSQPRRLRNFYATIR